MLGTGFNLAPFKSAPGCRSQSSGIVCALALCPGSSFRAWAVPGLPMPSQAPGSVQFLPVWMPIPVFWGCPAAWGVQESLRMSVPWGWGLAHPSALLLLGQDAAGPLDAALCAPRFCGECLQPCLQVPSPLCPLCRMPFDPKKVEKASSVEKQLSSYKAPCRGCSKKVKLVGEGCLSLSRCRSRSRAARGGRSLAVRGWVRGVPCSAGPQTAPARCGVPCVSRLLL